MLQEKWTTFYGQHVGKNMDGEFTCEKYGEIFTTARGYSLLFLNVLKIVI